MTKQHKQINKKLAIIIVILLLAGSSVSAYLLWRQSRQNIPTTQNSNASPNHSPTKSNGRPKNQPGEQITTPNPTTPNQNAPTQPGKTVAEPTKPDQTKQESKPEPTTKPSAPTQPNQPTPQQPQQPQSAPSTQPSPTPQTPNHTQQAAQLRSSIQATHKVKVRYGNETNSYQPGRQQTRPLTDQQAVTSLKELNQVLEKYPTGFFQEFNDFNMPITFFLVASVPKPDKPNENVFAGFADSQFKNDLKITLVKQFAFSFTAHHEIMHAIDAFMSVKQWPKNIFQEYTALNPPGFIYDQQNQSNPGGFRRFVLDRGDDPYFTTEYGQSNKLEDRAEVFKYMTREQGRMVAAGPYGGQLVHIFHKYPHLNAKARLIARQIDESFQTAGPNAYWTRFLK